MKSWNVHKFGGTSVAGADRYRHVAKLMREGKAPASRVGIVVSAMSKVTDALLELVELARKQDDSYLTKLEALRERHRETAETLLPEPQRSPVIAALEKDFSDLKEILRGVRLSKVASESTRELVSGHGEIWSAQLLHGRLVADGAKAAWLDARQVLVVEPGERSVTVLWKESQGKLDAWLAGRPEEIVVITGFVASTPEGVATTLKRNGSDYSASIFGALLSAEIVVIWTDVDGVLTADPRLVPDAVLVEEMSYAEATELAYFGAKVVHPATMAPAVARKIPLRIANTFRPEGRGTLIHAKPKPHAQPVKGFATIADVALVNVEGTGMAGVPGIAQRLFGALAEVGVSVILISQASSEHSICFAIPEKQAEAGRAATEKAFYAELHRGEIQKIEVVQGCTVLAIVGDGMVHRPGIAALFFGALGRAGVNIRAIAQGSSERNISIVCDGADATKALRAAHSAFYLSPQTISIGVIGTGRVGAALLEQLRDEAPRLRRDFHIDLRVRGILSSKRMLLSDEPLDLARWKEIAESAPAKPDLGAFLQHVQAPYLPHAAIVDATASSDLAGRYADWLRRGLHVVTPNKIANTGPLSAYLGLFSAAREAGRQYLYETTCGAGLPLLRTLRDLVRTGDRIIRIEGVLSGTLSFLLNSLESGKLFSALVAEAEKRGYTEPDPREDLSGRDVARKLVILAREAGLSLELSDIVVESLVPEAQAGLTVEAWRKKLPDGDAAWTERRKTAATKNHVLRYCGVIEESGKATVGLREFPTTHPFARLGGTDNIVAFTTARYREQPLVVQGPGAGPEVTAAGIFADLLRLVSSIQGGKS